MGGQLQKPVDPVNPSSTEDKGPVGSLKHILKQFHDKKVRVPQADKKRNVAIMQNILDTFITAMKAADPLFNELFQRMFYAGSYFEGLKVTDANEFDLNLILKLPFKRDDVEVIYNVPDGYAQYRLRQPLEVLLSRHPKWNVYQKLSSIMDGDFLSQKKMNEWCQAVGDKALQKNQPQFRNIKRSRHGPALTLTITTEGTTVLDVDLVPVVQLNEYPPTARKIYYVNDSTTFLVPKPNATNAETTLFRISMPLVEREVMDNMGCVKMLIRIFKVIRDNENWNRFASYYIKTVFLWHLERHHTDQYWHYAAQYWHHTDQYWHHTDQYWGENRLDVIFVEMLKQFIDVFEKKELKHFLFDEYNLISGINEVALDNMMYRLRLYLDKSQRDLEAFKKLLYGE